MCYCMVTWIIVPRPVQHFSQVGQLLLVFPVRTCQMMTFVEGHHLCCCFATEVKRLKMSLSLSGTLLL